MRTTGGSIPSRVGFIVAFGAISSIWLLVIDNIGSWAGSAFLAAATIGSAFASRRRVAWLLPASIGAVSLAAVLALLDAGWLPVIRIGG